MTDELAEAKRREDLIDQAIEAACDASSAMPPGKRGWNERDYALAEAAARKMFELTGVGAEGQTVGAVETDRAAFEAWFDAPVQLERSGDGYKFITAQSAWTVWQAARSQPGATDGAGHQRDCARPVDTIRRA